MDDVAITQLEDLISEARQVAHEAGCWDAHCECDPVVLAARDEYATWLEAFADRQEDVLRAAGYKPFRDRLAEAGIPDDYDAVRAAGLEDAVAALRAES